MVTCKRISPARKRLNEEIAHCHKAGYKVSFVKDRHTADYLGMNDKAAKAMGFPIKGKKKLIVDKNLSLKDKRDVLKHERIERGLMAKGMPYWAAHRRALREEGC